MPRLKTFLDVRPTAHADWQRLTDAPSAEQGLKLGDLVAADLDDTGTWPRWAEVRVTHGSQTIEHWLCRDRTLRPTTDAGYVTRLMEQVRAQFAGCGDLDALARKPKAGQRIDMDAYAGTVHDPAAIRAAMEDTVE
jgi:hypothetical protein